MRVGAFIIPVVCSCNCAAVSTWSWLFGLCCNASSGGQAMLQSRKLPTLLRRRANRNSTTGLHNSPQAHQLHLLSPLMCRHSAFRTEPSDDVTCSKVWRMGAEERNSVQSADLRTFALRWRTACSVRHVLCGQRFDPTRLFLSFPCDGTH